MPILKPDYSLSHQATIAEWVTTGLPTRIAAYQAQLDGHPDAPNSGLYDQQALYLGIEEIMAFTYSYFHTVVVDGFHEERNWLTGDYYANVVTEAIIQATAASPVNSLLFPIGYTELDPLQVPDLLGTSDTTLPNSEKEGLQEELDELTPPPLLPSGAVLLAAREKQRDALNAQLVALTNLSNNLDVGDPGQSNLAFATASANTALTRVLNLIANPSFYSTPQRLLQIDDRLNGGSTYNAELIIGVDQRAAQIVSDDDTYLIDRYFWLSRRINLAFGSLTRYRGLAKSIALIEDSLSDLQTELAAYISMGFP